MITKNMGDFSVDCENEIEIHAQLTCRCCLLISTDGEDLKNLFSTVLIDGKLLAVPMLIFKIFGVTVTKTDGLPTRICGQCLDQVQKSFTFRKKFERTNKTLHQILNIPLEDNVRKKVTTASVDCQTESVLNKSVLAQTNVIDWKHAATQCAPIETMNGQSQTERLTAESVCVNTDIDGLVFENLEPADKQLGDVIIEEYCEEEYLVEDETQDFKPTVESFLAQEPTTDLQVAEYYCTVCDREVQDQCAMEMHKNGHARTYRKLLASTPMYNCGSCRSIFLTLAALDKHIAQECQPIDYLNLPVEPSEPMDIRVDVSATFVSVKRQNGVYVCACDAFWDVSLKAVVGHCIKDHVLTNDEFSVTPHSCGICGRVFTTAFATRIHILSHARFLSCSRQCDFKCDNLDQLLDHEMNGHELSDSKCRHCGQQFDDDLSEAQHGKACSERRYQCAHCDKRFLKPGTLKIHERIHSGKRLECDICGQRFVQNGDLKCHQRIHTGNRPYKCEICGKQFRISSHRADHMSTHTTANEFQCTVCEKWFKSKRILAAHGRMHDAGNRKHKCNVCFKTFLRNTHLQSHYRVHQPKGTEK